MNLKSKINFGKWFFRSQRYYKIFDSGLLWKKQGGFKIKKRYSNDLIAFNKIYLNYFFQRWWYRSEGSDVFSFYKLFPLAIIGLFIDLKEVFPETENISTSGGEDISTYSSKFSKKNEFSNFKNSVAKFATVSEDESNCNKKDIPPLPPPQKKDDKTSSTFVPHVPSKKKSVPLKVAIDDARRVIHKKMNEAGTPGIAVAVSVDGKNVWLAGFGYADVENQVQCTPYTVMRIASISKSLTMTVVARLQEEGKLDIDLPINTYVPNFPKKKIDGQEVTITTRHLLNHTSGIRHYKLKNEKNDKSNVKPTALELKSSSDKNLKSLEKAKAKKKNLVEILAGKILECEEKEEKSEFDLHEYYIKEDFKTTKEALTLFENDELHSRPGDCYLYSTHAWTLVSAVLEGASGEKFTPLMRKLFHDLGLEQTYIDQNDPIIYKRARYYIRDKHGRLQNAPYVSNSYKLAGGGFLSTVIDLNQFGNAMLYSYQYTNEDVSLSPGFLRSSTVKQMWSSSSNTKCDWDLDGSYGLGWAIVEQRMHSAPFCHKRRFYASHTGGAIGASSVLLILPKEDMCSEKGTDSSDVSDDNKLPEGVVVSLITNMQGVGLNKTALEIAKNFEGVEIQENIVGKISDRPDSKVFSLKHG